MRLSPRSAHFPGLRAPVGAQVQECDPFSFTCRFPYPLRDARVGNLPADPSCVWKEGRKWALHAGSGSPWLPLLSFLAFNQQIYAKDS